MRVRPASRVYRTWGFDSRRWDGFVPRDGDIVIATYPKCGTTWMQRIVGLLVFQDPAPVAVMDVSVWIDRRFGATPAEALARVEAQTHRRFLKSHLPADGLPLHDEVRYIHVARDGREVCLSFHNHVLELRGGCWRGSTRPGSATRPSRGATRARRRTRPTSSTAGWSTAVARR